MKVVVTGVILFLFVGAVGLTSVRANGQSARYSSEEEFFSSAAYFAYFLIRQDIQCLRDNHLFEPDAEAYFREVPSRVTLIEDCVWGMRALSRNRSTPGYRPLLDVLFPDVEDPDGQSLRGLLSSFLHSLDSYTGCLQGSQYNCGIMGDPIHDNAKTDGRPNMMESFSGWAAARSVMIIAALYGWYYETWCPIPNRSNTSAFCVDVVGHE